MVTRQGKMGGLIICTRQSVPTFNEPAKTKTFCWWFAIYFRFLDVSIWFLHLIGTVPVWKHLLSSWNQFVMHIACLFPKDTYYLHLYNIFPGLARSIDSFLRQEQPDGNWYLQNQPQFFEEPSTENWCTPCNIFLKRSSLGCEFKVFLLLDLICHVIYP